MISNLADARLKSARNAALLPPTKVAVRRVQTRPSDVQKAWELLDDLVRGERVLMSKIRRAVGSEYSELLSEELGTNREMREIDSEAVATLRPYSERIRIADLLDSHAERRSVSAASRKSLANKAEAHYEAALDILEELKHSHPGLQANLDRSGRRAPSRNEVPRRTKLARKNVDLKVDLLVRCVKCPSK